jgi:hypothetical protein
VRLRKSLIRREKAYLASSATRSGGDHDAVKYEPVVDMAIREWTEDELRLQFLDDRRDLTIDGTRRLGSDQAGRNLQESRPVDSELPTGALRFADGALVVLAVV